MYVFLKLLVLKTFKISDDDEDNHKQSTMNFAPVEKQRTEEWIERERDTMVGTYRCMTRLFRRR